MFKLFTPKNGWIHLETEKNGYGLSYLTNVPLDLLNACIASLRYNVPFSMDFDLEGSMLCIVNTGKFGDLFFIKDGELNEKYDGIEMCEFSKYIKDYIYENLDECIKFTIFCEPDDEEYSEEYFRDKEILTSKLELLNKLIIIEELNKKKN